MKFKMKENMNKILYAISIIIIVVGAIICFTKGFNKELLYSNRQEMLISSNTEIDITKVEEISKSVLDNKKVKVQKIERFGNAVKIISIEINEEQKQDIINKINEQLSMEISNDDITITNIPNTRLRDIAKPYIFPGLISIAIVLLYFAIWYNKIGITKVLLKGILMPTLVELVYYSIILIARIPFSKITTSIAIGLYVIAIMWLTMCLQKEKISKINKKEND